MISPPKCTAFGQPAQSQCDIFVVASDEQMDYNSIQTAHSCFFTHKQWWVRGRVFLVHFVLKLACFQIAWWVSTFCNDGGPRSANEVWLASRHEVSPSKLFSRSLISNVWGNTSFNRSLMLTVSFKVNFLLHTARLQIACQSKSSAKLNPRGVSGLILHYFPFSIHLRSDSIVTKSSFRFRFPLFTRLSQRNI